MILLINYYIDKHPERQAELKHCLENNINNPFIKRIIIFHDENVAIPVNDKIRSIKYKGRPTYEDYFKAGNNYDGIKILANTDIYFDDTLHHCNKITDKQVYALCRWEYKDGELVFYNHRDSQDAWIWRDIINLKCNFYLGIPGCDNKIAYLIFTAGYDIKSPSHTIHAIHHHQTQIRNYSERDIVSAPYAYLKYHTIDDEINYKPVINIQGVIAGKKYLKSK